MILSSNTRTGWLCATGWQCAIVSIAFLAGTIIQGLLVLNDASYVFERWHGTMLVIAITTFAILFNTFLAKKLPFIEGLILIIHIVGLFAIVIPLWVLSPRNTAHSVFLEFSNNGGWSSTGTSCMVGLSTAIVSMLGFDCGVHMCKSIRKNISIGSHLTDRFPQPKKLKTPQKRYHEPSAGP